MKRLLAAACLVFGVTTGVTVLGIRSSGAQDFGLPRDDARVRRGYEIAPVPLRLQGLDIFLVGLGSYIVNAQGGCNDCHTNPPYGVGGDPFMGQPAKINAAGYLAGGTAFGPFVSRNLTPRNGLPAGLTLQQFHQVMRRGTDFKNRHPQMPLLQVMPWPVFANMTNLDIQAVYEFLRAVPTLPTAPLPQPLQPPEPGLQP